MACLKDLNSLPRDFLLEYILEHWYNRYQGQRVDLSSISYEIWESRGVRSSLFSRERGVGGNQF